MLSQQRVVVRHILALDEMIEDAKGIFEGFDPGSGKKRPLKFYLRQFTREQDKAYPWTKVSTEKSKEGYFCTVMVASVLVCVDPDALCLSYDLSYGQAKRKALESVFSAKLHALVSDVMPEYIRSMSLDYLKDLV